MEKNKTLEENIKSLDQTIKFLKSHKIIYTNIIDGCYSYADEIEALGYFVEQEQYANIYLDGRGKELTKLNPTNFTFEECITYLHHIWKAENLAGGWIYKQSTNGQLLKTVEKIKGYLKTVLDA